MGNITGNVLKELSKRFGAHAIESGLTAPRIPTQMTELDVWMGGGLPRGRMIELFGKESTGKSTLALELAKRVQSQAGEHVCWIDYEWSFEQGYAESIGVSFEKSQLLVARPNSIEDGFEVMRALMQQVPGGLYIIDSLAAGEPIGELDRTTDKIGSHSAAVSSSIRKINQPLGQSGAVLLIINQLRTQMTKGGPGGMQVSRTTTGGFALKFYAAMRWSITKEKKIMKQIKGKPTPVWTANLKMVKTKVSKTEGESVGIWVVPCFGCRVSKARTPIEQKKGE